MDISVSNSSILRPKMKLEADVGTLIVKFYT